MIEVEFLKKTRLNNPVAIVGSPGLRSVGKLVIMKLVEMWKAELFARIYSPHFPAIYLGPSYLYAPAIPGAIYGVEGAELPCVKLYSRRNVILVQGWQSQPDSQFEVADKVVEVLKEHGTRMIVGVGAHGSGGKGVFFAATDEKIASILSSQGMKPRESGEFYGFTAMVLGVGKLRGIPGFCIFGETSVAPNLEQPDPDAADRVLHKLLELLKPSFLESVLSD